MTYTVTWYRYPHGDEGEEMDSNSREFTSFEKALKFLEGRVRLIKSTHWGGGYIEDDNCKLLYDVDYEGNPEDLRETC